LPSGDERERVIQYVYRRYGQRGAAMTANVITYRNRMAAREMGKAMGFDPETLKRISAAVATWEFKDENDALDHRLRDAGLDLRHPRIRKYFELCIAAQGLPRHLGQHSGGMVICEGRLDSVVPLEPASMPGRVVVQWDKEDCADMRIIKVDLLGLGMMAVLKDSLELIHDHYHYRGQDKSEEVDLAHLPQNDPLVYSTLQKADTVGMFQVESRAQMACLPRLMPKKFYDIVVQVAIIRPGPIVGNMVNPFLKRRQGREEVTYPHPSLEAVLGRTLGVPLFQEQLLRMAMITANFTGGEAEELRRAMGFKRSEARMKVIEEKLRAGMTRNGILGETQEQIIQSITSFALYGFPESHAASFALIAYASAYLKCHYLAAFTAALLNNQPMGFYHPSTIVKDAQRHGLKMLPMDVMRSDWRCSLEPVLGAQFSLSKGDARIAREKLALRLGLKYAHGLREPAAQALVRERSLRPFASVQDLASRVPELRKNELTTLAEIGALNTIVNSPLRLRGEKPFHRRDALWQVERAVRWSGPLLDELPEDELPGINAGSPLAAMTREERLVADFRATGLTVGPHPMQYRREDMKRMGIYSARDLAHLPNGRRLRIGGCVIARQRPGTAKGMMFLSLEDETGIANAIVAPDLLQKNRVLLISERFLMVEGILQNQDNVIHIKAEKVSPLNITRAETASHDFH
jgi:error-prone DNA polymerase